VLGLVLSVPLEILSTDDPELRFTQNGTPVTNFGLAVNQRIRQDDGTWRDGETSFFRVNAWATRPRTSFPV
jgi:single-stranded DNA-binding protein